MTEPTPSPDEALDRLLRAARPTATPNADVRDRQRAELVAAASGASSPRRRPGRGSRYAAVAAVLALVAGGAALVARSGGGSPRTDVLAGSDHLTGGAGAALDVPLTSDACGGLPLPFEVPVDAGFAGPVDGAAPGGHQPDVAGQLVAHWLAADTVIEVRWPADVSEVVLRSIDLTRGDIPTRVSEGVAGSTFARSDLGLDLIEEPDGTLGVGFTYSSRPDLDGTYTIATERYVRTDDEGTMTGRRLSPVWGDGMCSTVQLTVRALDGRDDVRPRAKALYEALIAPGGPLVPVTEDLPLVVDRLEAEALAPVTPCQVPAGVDQDPIRSEAIAGPGPFATPDEALAAYLETMVRTHDGPFGPMESPGAPSEGYTAISLPDGRVAYQWPAGVTDVVGYYFAERSDDGWTITWTEGPSC